MITDRVPRLWCAAYGSHRSPVTRFLSRRMLRLVSFLRMLAEQDRTPFVLM